MTRIAFRNFTGGEVTPTLSARYDLKKMGSFLQACQNFLPNLHGDVERRPGMVFVDAIGNNACVLLPFIFNTERKNNYVLIFSSDGNIRVAQESGLIGSAPMESPYELNEVYEISIVQLADVLYLAHPNHPLMKLYRRGKDPYEWKIDEVTINKSLPPPEAPIVEFQRNNADDTAELNYDLSYKVSAVDWDGVESVGSGAGGVRGKYPTDWVVGNCVALKWTPVSGAKEYNVYRESAGFYGFIGISNTIDENGYVVFSDQNYEPDTSVTPKYDWNPFMEEIDGETVNYPPACVCFHGQRLWLAGGTKNPATLYASRVGDFESFRKSSPLQDDDPLEFMLASGSIDDIRWMVSFNDLIVGTAGAEYRVTSSGAAITPSDCQINTQSFWGSSNIQPELIGQSILHCQRSGSHVRDLFYSWESDGYAGNDLSVLAPQLVEEHYIKQWCFQQSPSPRLWAVRDDGVLLCLSYMKEQNIFGWSRHRTDGFVWSVACINGEASDVVMIVVERDGACVLERLDDGTSESDKVADVVYLDCAHIFEGDYMTEISGEEEITLTYLIGEDTEVTNVDIYGGASGNDTNTGGGGNDTNTGGGGDDTGGGGTTGNRYVVEGNMSLDLSGYTHDDSIHFGGGISPDDITISITGTNVLLEYRYSGGFGVVNLIGWGDSSDRLDRVTFEDGYPERSISDWNG